MDTEALCDSLIARMERQIELLEEIVNYEVTLKESVVAHDWTRLELSERRMTAILEMVAEAEQARLEAFTRLSEAVGEDEESGFQQVLFHLDPSRQERAFETFRTLQFTVLKIQGMTNSIDIYLKTVTGAMQEILAELYPFRKGSIYTKNGTARESRSNPMVFSRKL